MTGPVLPAIDVTSPRRFERQTAIPGWSQEILARAKVLVAGAGALGNETLKNLVLLGIGKVATLDRDFVEESNLARSVLFRQEDIGREKVTVVRERLQQLNPETEVVSMRLDLMMELGSGVLAEYDLVLGCLDSIEARWKLNRLCRAARIPWIDSGIGADRGQISFFAGDTGPCYECGMTASMWQRMHQRHSCRLPHDVSPEQPVATNQILASLIASLQVQEAITYLHQQNPNSHFASAWTALNPGDHVTVCVSPYALNTLHSRQNDSCLAHEENVGPFVHSTDVMAPVRTTSARQLLSLAGAEYIELDWDLTCKLTCSFCGHNDSACLPAWELRSEILTCPDCNHPRTLAWINKIDLESPLADRSLEQLGVPPQAYLHLVTRRGHRLQCKLAESLAVRT